VWRHLLNVYPAMMTGAERIDYCDALAIEYYIQKESWQSRLR